jgi:Fur family ferric uptake transcriptional regulator
VLEFRDDAIEAAQQRIAAERGFRVTDHSLYIHGVCSNCQGEAGR